MTVHRSDVSPRFSLPGGGRLQSTASAPPPGGRDGDRRTVREARRQAARKAHADARMGMGPAWPEAWLEPADEIDEAGVEMDRRHTIRVRRMVMLGLVVLLLLAVALPRIVEAAEPWPSFETAEGTVVRVTTGSAGHRLDGGYVREVEAGIDGAVWVAVGNRVLELGTPGSVQPRQRGWQAFPRRLSVQSDGTLWAVEDGGRIVTLGETGWTTATPPERVAPDPLDLEEDALRQLRAAGVERPPRVLTGAVGPDQRRWLLVDVSAHPHQGPTDRRLLRFDGSSWAVLGPDEGMPRDQRRAWTDPGPEASVALAVDGGGRAWFSLERGGLWLADDVGIRSLGIPGLGSRALDLSAAPDGAMWIASSRGELFRWDPQGPTPL